MSNLLLIPFGIFFTCCVLRFVTLASVRNALAKRHPETFYAIGEPSFLFFDGVTSFIRGNSYKALADPELDRRVRNHKLLAMVAIGSWVIFGIALFSLPISAPKLPIGLANGSYTNACCGTLKLENGQMTGTNRQVTYVVESDKIGAYVLPSVYVGAFSHGFVVDPKRTPLKLRLDAEEHPRSIELMDWEHGAPFVFRKSGEIGKPTG